MSTSGDNRNSPELNRRPGRNRHSLYNSLDEDVIGIRQNSAMFRQIVKESNRRLYSNLPPHKRRHRSSSLMPKHKEEVGESRHVTRGLCDVKPQVSTSLENAKQNETRRDITLVEREHSQSNATPNVPDNNDVNPELPQYKPDEIRTIKPETLEAVESNGQSEGFDINQVLDQIRRGKPEEAEAKIVASEFGPFYESDPELVLLLKIQVLIEFWKGNEETDADVRKIYLLGKTISSLAHGLPSLGARIQKKVEDSLRLSFCAKNQVLEKHAYLLLPEEHLKVANLIEVAFNAYKARKAARDASRAYQNLMRSM
ncbi:hypothetical protein DdX_14065 [Ditylenchus destructor]|uniref:CTLH domain-containing protein n=1 Tax=Ditylenchus destructor TaxID=166010 RepID=A0AAD4MU28_9BILA|nr:hypothetical protein DdX_14065 [Ditylenchus destructor]